MGSTTEAPRLGSPIIAALEDAWNAIRVRHPDVPSVLLVIGTGRDGRRKGLKYGHYWDEVWEDRAGKVSEVLIGGEGMKRGARGVMTTLIHEAAHAMAKVRGIQDTSRQGRYHNKRFKVLAEELGLEIAYDKRIGWSPSTMPDATAEEYADTLAALEEALKVYRPDDVRPETGKKSPPPCQCGCGRKIRVAPSVLELGPIACHVCGDDFRPVGAVV